MRWRLERRRRAGAALGCRKARKAAMYGDDPGDRVARRLFVTPPFKPASVAYGTDPY
jgi:hypothetical protein